MASFLRSNTQPTGIQQAIEKAIDGNQSTEDWSLIMKICDHVGSHEQSAKEAMKIIRKRLQTNPLTDGWRSIGYTLSLLEALAKNCGKVFHLQIAHKDFLKELKGLIGPKNNPPPSMQDRVLGMIQTWALAFRQDPDLKNLEHFYQECRQQGLVFPPAESDNTIQAALPATGTMERPLQSTRSMSQTSSGSRNRQNRSGSDGASYSTVSNQTMSAEQLAKLRSELDVVQANAQVFGEMLVTLQPAEENPQDFELLMELHNTCKQMQARIFDLLSQISSDDITVDLLRYNDEFNNSFKTFEQYMQERDRRFSSGRLPNSSNRANSTLSQSATKHPLPSARNTDDEPSLIRFDDDPIPVASSFQNMRINPTSSNIQSQSTASATARSVPNVPDPERDAREVEEWLKNQGDDLDDEPSRQDGGGGTTAAFNNFLQKRASAMPNEQSSGQQFYPNLHPSNTHL